MPVNDPLPPVSDASLPAKTARRRILVRAIEVGERIDTTRFERDDLVSRNPLAFAHGEDGFVVLFRFGVAVLFGLTPIDEERIIEDLASRIGKPFAKREEEAIFLEIGSERDDHIPPGGPIHLHSFSGERALVIADALAKSVALARDEREVARVLDSLEPFARRLAETGKTMARRHTMVQTIGQSLLVRQRVVGRIAIEEKPDVLWDRPDLERLFARAEDEFELRERAQALKGKLTVIGETATALTDLVDTERSLRLEMTIVFLILFEITITFYQMWAGRGH